MLLQRKPGYLYDDGIGGLIIGGLILWALYYLIVTFTAVVVYIFIGILVVIFLSSVLRINTRIKKYWVNKATAYVEVNNSMETFRNTVVFTTNTVNSFRAHEQRIFESMKVDSGENLNTALNYVINIRGHAPEIKSHEVYLIGLNKCTDEFNKAKSEFSKHNNIVDQHNMFLSHWYVALCAKLGGNYRTLEYVQMNKWVFKDLKGPAPTVLIYKS